MTITIVGGGNPSGPTFPVQRSVRLRASNTAYFTRTPATTTNQTTFTWSSWIKLANFATADPRFYAGRTGLNFNAFSMAMGGTGGTIYVDQYTTGGAMQFQITTASVYRDPSAWYHLVIAFDTTQATAANRVRIYVNGVQLTAFSGTPTYPSQNFAVNVNTPTTQFIGAAPGNSTYFDGYLSEINFLDGYPTVGGTTYNGTTWAALNVATLFGSYNSYGVWSPSKYSGTYGTNGYYLNFQDNSNNTATTIGKDSSGNGNNWTPNGIVVSPPTSVSNDSMLDVPTLTGANNANFAVANPLNAATSLTVNDGNLKLAASASGSKFVNSSILLPSSGAYYAEITFANASSAGIGQTIGIALPSRSLTATNSATGAYLFYGTSSGALISNGTAIATGLSLVSANEVFQVAVDVTNSKMWIGRSNVWYNSTGGTTGNPSTGANPTFTGAFADYFIYAGFDTASAVFANFNFGQRPFSYTPPTGFKSLNTYNLPAPTIPNGATQFAATLYTGTAAALTVTNTVNGKSFQPDFVWIKDRTTALNHRLLDSVRGVTSLLYSNLTDAQVTIPNANDSFTSFNSNGFTLGVGQGMNASGDAYVGWQWKASNAAAVTNTSGSISSQVSANPSAGFSIVSFTGTGANATVGHGLNIVPRMIIVKNRDSAAIGGAVYHASLGATKYLQLFQTTTGNATETTDNTAWNGGSPTFSSSVFSVGALNRTNSAQQMVAYCWSEIPGFSKFGSYIGNNALDGPFIYLGFRPRFILVKNSNSATDWTIFDTSRDTFNLSTKYLIPNTSGQETSGSSVQLDVLSNGFKVRGTWAGMNTSGNTIIYACFAENPFNYSLAR